MTDRQGIIAQKRTKAKQCKHSCRCEECSDEATQKVKNCLFFGLPRRQINLPPRNDVNRECFFSFPFKLKTLNLFSFSPIKLSAFTLAEVLITLGIIGVIAELTIPSLINNINNQVYKVAYKHAFSVLSQAWMNAGTNGTITPCTTWGDWQDGGTCHFDNFTALKKEFKVAKDCGTDTASCWDMSGEQSWQDQGGYPWTTAQAFIDNSGVAWSQLQSNPAYEIIVDTNGFKGPNKYGKDRAVMYAYYSVNDIGGNYKANVPVVINCWDMPSDPPNLEDQRRCPSVITDANYHCYYQSWLTGGGN